MDNFLYINCGKENFGNDNNDYNTFEVGEWVEFRSPAYCDTLAILHNFKTKVQSLL